MKAIIMAGGEGTRLRPLTCSIPKPMASFFSKPLVEYQVELLKEQGIFDLKFTLMYKPNVVMDYFGSGRNFGVNIEYYIEDSPLGTAGSVKNACREIDETFIVISGDCLTDIDINKAIAFHKEKGAKATIVLKKCENPLEFGIVMFDEKNSITRFLEKPDLKEMFSDTVNTGIYIFEPEILDLIPDDKMYDFSKEVFPDMLKKDMKMCGYIMDEYWCDLGNIESYIKAHENVLSEKCKITLSGTNIDGIRMLDDVQISNSALLEAPVFIGENVKIKNGTKIGKYSVIGNNVIIDENASIKKGVILKNAYIGKGSKISSAVICEDAKIENKNYVLESAVVGRKTVLCGENQVNPKVKIWPEKWIEKNVNVNENIIWGFGKRASLFSSDGAIGDLNVDFDAKKTTNLACAFAERFKKKGVLLCGCDDNKVSKNLLEIFINTLALNGQKVLKAGTCLLPVLRFGIKILDAYGGVYFRYINDKKIKIEILKEDGLTMLREDLKGVERKFINSEYSLFDSEQTKQIESINNIKAIYYADMKKKVKDLSQLKTNIFGIYKSNHELDGFIISIIEHMGLEFKYLNNLNFSDLDSDLEKYGCDFLIKNTGYTDKFELYTKNNVIKDTDDYLMMLYLYFMEAEKPEIIYITPLMPDGIIEMAQKKSIKHSVCKSDDLFSLMGQEFSRIYHDAIYFQIKLIESLSNKEQNINMFLSQIPKQHLKEKHVNCEWKDVGRVINEVNNKNYDHEAVEGIKIFHSGGWGLIYPADDASKIVIRAQGKSEEYAKEICDFHYKEIKEILKFSKYN
jgi:mannose-1-phosphate guanylyltransferase / phosphomannomutase